MGRAVTRMLCAFVALAACVFAPAMHRTDLASFSTVEAARLQEPAGKTSKGPAKQDPDTGDANDSDGDKENERKKGDQDEGSTGGEDGDPPEQGTDPATPPWLSNTLMAVGGAITLLGAVLLGFLFYEVSLGTASIGTRTEWGGFGGNLGGWQLRDGLAQFLIATVVVVTGLLLVSIGRP